jgi:hypothetical protein
MTPLPIRRWPGAIAVALLHLLLLGALLTVRPVQRTAPQATAAVPLLRWLAPALPDPQVPQPRVAKPATRPGDKTAAPPPLAQPAAPQAITLPATAPPDRAANTLADRSGSASAPGPPLPASAPLNLAWPGSGRAAPPSLAAQAARAAKAEAALDRDARLANALGTDTTLRTQALADGTLRLRQGTGCVDAHPSRAQGLDTFNQSTHPLPRSVESCR